MKRLLRSISARGAARCAVAFAIVVATSTGVAAAAPGTITPAYTDSWGCPETYACFWDQTYGYGDMGKVADNNTNFTDFKQSNCPNGTWNDCIKSLDNFGDSCTVYFWTGANYTGRWHSVGIGDKVRSFAIDWNDSAFNDSISSDHWCSPSPQ